MVASHDMLVTFTKWIVKTVFETFIYVVSYKKRLREKVFKIQQIFRENKPSFALKIRETQGKSFIDSCPNPGMAWYVLDHNPIESQSMSKK